jgi:hypothetical protein
MSRILTTTVQKLVQTVLFVRHLLRYRRLLVMHHLRLRSRDAYTV